VAEKRARQQLARAAARLAAKRGAAWPPLVLMTDDDRLPDPLPAAEALPRGSIVIVRARDAADRAKLATAILRIARARHLIVLIADDAPLAARLGADGLHLPEAKAHTAAHWRARYPRWRITTSSHGAIRIPDAVDAVLLSAIFPTRSHNDRDALGAVKANIIAAQMRKPVYALGGITPLNATRLSSAFAGLAAIGALLV
jgi:thiamine-phosphate pyrophosphorylase